MANIRTVMEAPEAVKCLAPEEEEDTSEEKTAFPLVSNAKESYTYTQKMESSGRPICRRATRR